jgi:hypothetical protein
MKLDDWRVETKLDSNNTDLIFPKFLSEFPNLKFTTSPTEHGLVKIYMGTLKEFKELLTEKSEKITLKSIHIFKVRDPITYKKVSKLKFRYAEEI